MEYQEILQNARTCMGPYCKACPVCNGQACKNTIPGPGAKGSGTGFARNYQKWQELRVNLDTIGENRRADTSFDFFGHRLALPVMAVYALITGCTPSVIRSVIMNALLLLGPLLDRESDAPTSLSFALMVLLFQNPHACQSVGLQLSFASVAGILAFSGRISGALTAHLPKAGRGKGLRPRLLGLLRGAAVSLGTTVGATAFTLPLGAWYFGTVSLVAPVANLLCLFLIQLTFQAGLLTALLARAVFHERRRRRCPIAELGFEVHVPSAVNDEHEKRRNDRKRRDHAQGYDKSLFALFAAAASVFAGL